LTTKQLIVFNQYQHMLFDHQCYCLGSTEIGVSPRLS
jgi:hypothetical protein